MADELTTIFRFVRSLGEQAELAPKGDYKKGYLVALEEVEEFLADRAWDTGIDLEED